MIDAYASLPHYWQHIAPVFDALPPDLRGTVWAPRQGCHWGRSLTTRPRRDPWGPVLVASYADAKRMAGRRLVYVEHGAGQSYVGIDNGSYAGGSGLGDVVLFLCPSESVAERWRAAYPDATAAVVGCPRLDVFHRAMPIGITPTGIIDGGTLEQPGCARRPHKPKVGGSNPPGAPHPSDKGGRAGHHAGAAPRRGPVVALAHHWRCGLLPETQPAVDHFKAAYPALRDAVRSWGGELLGHGHPRAWREYGRLWASLGVEAVESSDEVLRRADLLIVDNSSLAYEFASLNKAVVCLNQPAYRRDVEHGLRFWTNVPGLEVDEPGDLLFAVAAALEDGPEAQEDRQRAVQAAYAYTDGRAAERAAAAIVEVLGG